MFVSRRHSQYITALASRTCVMCVIASASSWIVGLRYIRLPTYSLQTREARAYIAVVPKTQVGSMPNVQHLDVGACHSEVWCSS